MSYLTFCLYYLLVANTAYPMPCADNTVFARVYAALFGQEFTLQNWGAAFSRNIVLLMTEPATPVLYVAKLPVETASA
jgi:hypothetical protein